MTTAPETADLVTSDGGAIKAHSWLVDRPRGVVQLTHGMGEHALRYADLAAALNRNGWSVVGQDHRGHGASVAKHQLLGAIGADGWESLVSDISAVAELSRSIAPDRPLVLFGHSMGSFAVQQFLPDHSDEVDAVVLTGTAALDLLEPALDLDSELDLAMFNAPFAPARTDFDWLSRDTQQVDHYISDPLTGFGLDIEATKALFAGAGRLTAPEALTSVSPGLPVLISVGDADPINGGLALVRPLLDRYRDAGLSDVTLKAYAGARHELTNETNRGEFMNDLVSWLDNHFPI